MSKNCEKVEEAKKRPRRSDLDTLQPNSRPCSRDEPYISSSQHENWFLGQRALLISPEAILSRHTRAKSAVNRSWHGRNNGSGIKLSLILSKKDSKTGNWDVLGDINKGTRYKGKVVGDSPEFCRGLDAYGFSDFKRCTERHRALTSSYPIDDPRRFNFGTPSQAWSTMKRCWTLEPNIR